MDELTLLEPLPVLELVGGATLTLVEPTPLLSLTGKRGASLILTEPIPQLYLEGRGGNLVLTEPLPVLSLNGIWNSKGSFDFTEPIPVFAATGRKVSTLTLLEPLPNLDLISRIPGTLSLTEPLPKLSFAGDVFGGATLNLTEPVPILQLIGFLPELADQAAPDTGLIGEIRPLEEYTAWAVNPANRAHSGFTDYEYSSLLYFNGKYYGTRDDGLFELTGDTDNGVEIQAKNIWGPSELGTTHWKRFYRAIIKLRDRGARLVLGITTDEDELTTFDVDPTSKTGLHRLVIRGRRDVAGTEMAPELNNVDGGDFDVHEFEVKAQNLPRGRG